MKTPVVSMIGFALLALSLPAQLAEKKVLTLDGAKAILAAAEADAAKRNFPVAIAVVDDGGHLLALHRQEGVQVAASSVATGKARTAALFSRPTRVFEDLIKGGRTAMVALDDFTPLTGGVPVVIEGRTVGAVGVSGNSPPVDEEIALAGIAGLATAAAPSAVRFHDHARVAEAFRTGAVLEDGGHFMIHASRRDAAGQAEVHREETDILYVLEGAARFVTGGKVVAAQALSADEIRGASIDGGEERRLVPGVVVVVPKGTPHWFREVQGPFLYYVVKVR